MGKGGKAEKDESNGLITLDEMKDREKKYLQRMADMGVSCTLIKDSSKEFARLEEERTNNVHWDHYVGCEGLPRPYVPREIRTFLAKKRFYQQFFTDRTVDWTLSVDDRTILTQSIFRIDRTRELVKETFNDPIGERFAKDISMFLQSLNMIDYMLDTAAEMERVDLARQIDIMEARREIEHEIDDSFDRLTYGVIRMDGVYLESYNSIVATWSHSSPQFGIDIWSLRDVPIRFQEMLAPIMVAEMKSTAVRVQMPLSVLHDCLTLRCIHTNFDFCSQYAKSFDAIIPEGDVEVNGGIVDIEECMVNEWLMQLNIQKELLAALLEKREIYDEIMRVIAERTEKLAKEKKSGEETSKIVIPKPPKEALFVPPNMVPEAFPTFLEREQQQYLDTLEEIYNPGHLKLRDNEINLRQYIMLGGLYSIMFVRRPTHTHYQRFNMTLHEDGRVLHIKDDLKAELHFNNRATTKLSTARVQMNEDKRKTFKIEDNELPYFFVTINMPLQLCLWGNPVPCQYIDSIEDVMSETSINGERKETVFKKKKSRFGSTKGHVAAQQLIDESLNQIVRTKPPSINLFRPTLITLLRTSRKLLPGERIVPVKNFHLVQQLDHLKIRQLQRYIVPRILSSFKFPLEIKEQMEQAFDSRPKKRNMLVRRRSFDAEEKLDVGELDFDYDVQEDAERMYPVFKELERFTYDAESIAEKDFEKKSIYGLVDTFDNIATRYIARHRDVMTQPEFAVKKIKKAAVPTDGRAPSIAKAKMSIRPGSRHSSLHEATSSNRFSNLSENQEDQEAPPPEDVVKLVEEYALPEKPKERVIRWTTSYIFSYQFDRAKRTMNIKTDRLGIFGFAYKRYEHFPFRDWSMQPSEDNNEEIILSVDTFHARVILYISAKGIRGYVTDISKAYVAHPVKYLNIEEPISDFRELRRRFSEKGINIFAEHDASYYIDNGYFSVKHTAMEDHTYDAMAMHCKLMKFYRSSWNRLASRRNILLGMKNAKDNSDYTEVTMRIQPDNVTFVEVSELCSDDLDIIKLDFKHTWRNMSIYTDLHQAINSMNPGATEIRNKDPVLLFQVKRMLSEIHVMNYS